MNERIKELARQSGMDIYGLGLDRNKWENTVERFAELIIQECCGIVLKNTNLHTYHQVKYEIKNHFGVE